MIASDYIRKNANRIYKVLIKLLDYRNNETIVFIDKLGFYHFDKLQKFIDSLQRGSFSPISKKHDLNITNVTIQKSLFDDKDDILFIYII